MFRAPGRVNLIGGQVDYHEGWIVSMAIDRDVHITAAPRADGRIVARSREFDGAVDVPADGGPDPRAVEPRWGRAIAGVARVLHELGREPVGATLDITSDVPLGAGLSSSAAFSVACTLALAHVAAFTLAGAELALAAQKAEQTATGVPCGIQDPMASACGTAGSALFLDCRTLELESVPIPSALAVLVVDTGVPRFMEATPYAQRRAESQAVAAELGVPFLRDATVEQVRDIPRGRHAVTEMQRVRAFASALRAGDIDALGPLMLASHASSRDDMEVSIPELDGLVEILVAAGALGARLTGAGFGGCVVALVPAPAARQIAVQATATYRARFGPEPAAWVMRASAGASAVEAGTSGSA
ncbi:MAG TPA: galactokinase family protein [Acidimicrobiia bacterium]|nr:galactokinase family protein [Acidimicrobiia bacterium]